MISLLLTLLLLFSSSFVSFSEKLPEIRKSCKYQKILIVSKNYTKLNIDWILPEHVRNIIEDECNHAKDGIFADKFNKKPSETREKQLHECEGSNRKKRGLKTKLPKEPFFEGFSKMSGNENVVKSTLEFRCMIRDLLRNNDPHPAILRELSKEAEKKLENHSEPNVRLHGVHYSKCIGNTIIRVHVEVMHPDELLIWKCEDIGEEKNNSYHFYNLEPTWMVEDESGNTFKINLHMCSQNKLNQLFCPSSSKASSSSYHTATCSPNNIDSCQKTVIRPKRNIGSFARTLPDGISIYGTFKEVTRITEKTRREGPIGVNPGLFYFSFNTSTFLAEKIDKMM